MSHAERQLHGIRAGILGDGGLGKEEGGEVLAGRGVSVLGVSGSKIWMGSLLDGAGY